MEAGFDMKPSELHDQENIQPPSPHKRMRAPRATRRYQWKPRFWASVPWMAVSLTYISMIASITTTAFLYRWVHHVAVSDWPWPKAQPSTIVSLMSAAGNQALHVALIDAVAVYFWKRSFRPFPLSNIHYYWRSAQGTYAALLCLLKVTSFAILSIIIHTSTVFRDPLFQNSIRINENSFYRNGTIKVPVVSELDPYFAGSMTGRAQNVMITGNFSQILTDYQQRNPILINDDCLNCNFSVKAFGFNTECSTTTTPYNVSAYADSEAQMFETMELMTVQVSSAIYDSTTDGYLNVTVSRRPSLDCTGDAIVQTCYLYPAEMTYSLHADQGVVTFRNSSWRSDTFSANTSLTSPSGGTDGNLAAFLDFGYTLFKTNATLYFAGARGWDYGHTGMLAGTYIIPPTNETCGPAFSDPMDGIINSFRELSLRTSLKQASETQSGSQMVNYTSFSQKAVYEIDYRWVTGALIVSMAGVTCISICLWGFWHVGRPVTMSPLEMVKHFSYVGENHLRHFPPSRGADDMAAGKADRLMVQWAVDKENDLELTFIDSQPGVEPLKAGDYYNVAEEYED